MSREEAVTLASRTLAALLVVWTLAETSHLPATVYEFRHYANVEFSSPTATEYYRHASLISLCFLIVRIVGFSLMARWLHKGGPDIAELLLPSTHDEVAVAHNSQ